MTTKNAQPKPPLDTIFKAEYECKYCGQTFKLENRYIKHRCKEMIKEESLKTVTGQAAWAFYQKWMSMQKKSVSSPNAFLKSKYYKAFMKFAEFVKKVKMADVDIFIRMMKDKAVQPQLWTNDQMYALYIEYLDRNTTPATQAKITIKTLFKLAEAADCDVSEVFNTVHPVEILEFIRERKLSPWILLRSIKFRAMLECISEEERQLFEQLIRPSYWMAKFETNPKIVAKMTSYAKEMHL